MEIHVNGEPMNLAPDTSLTDLLAKMELSGRRVAIERNLEIVPRSQHGTTRLEHGDQIEVVQAIGGG
ncbi:sulfur carrier protein ThiS [Marinobacterium sp. CAU 1594]|nr:sulfur carrier protein ThiS [Marinobacterium arenosum]MBY4678365.1 sulfur carrier protein ThiS [Marinobacterium arenosum]